jgi:hypothetical protein
MKSPLQTMMLMKVLSVTFLRFLEIKVTMKVLSVTLSRFPEIKVA